MCHDGVGCPNNHAALGDQMLRETVVVLEPPESGSGDREVFRPLSAELRQVRQAVIVIAWMVTGVRAVFLLREMPGPPAAEVEQLGIPLADDKNCCVWRQRPTDRVLESSDE